MRERDWGKIFELKRNLISSRRRRFNCEEGKLKRRKKIEEKKELKSQSNLRGKSVGWMPRH